jgi:hypothetical protein
MKDRNQYAEFVESQVIDRMVSGEAIDPTLVNNPHQLATGVEKCQLHHLRYTILLKESRLMAVMNTKTNIV